MGIPISSPSYIHWDNMSVVHNIYRSKSVFRKKSNSVCYHVVCESVALGRLSVGHIPSSENVADLMEKVLCRQRRKYMVSNILYDIHDDH